MPLTVNINIHNKCACDHAWGTGRVGMAWGGGQATDTRRLPAPPLRGQSPPSEVRANDYVDGPNSPRCLHFCAQARLVSQTAGYNPTSTRPVFEARRKKTLAHRMTTKCVTRFEYKSMKPSHTVLAESTRPKRAPCYKAIWSQTGCCAKRWKKRGGGGHNGSVSSSVHPPSPVLKDHDAFLFYFSSPPSQLGPSAPWQEGKKRKNLICENPFGYLVAEQIGLCLWIRSNATLGPSRSFSAAWVQGWLELEHVPSQSAHPPPSSLPTDTLVFPNTDAHLRGRTPARSPQSLLPFFFFCCRPLKE